MHVWLIQRFSLVNLLIALAGLIYGKKKIIAIPIFINFLSLVNEPVNSRYLCPVTLSKSLWRTGIVEHILWPSVNQIVRLVGMETVPPICQIGSGIASLSVIANQILINGTI